MHETGGLTVARVMANAALFEQMLISGSTAMIFLTLDTERPALVSELMSSLTLWVDDCSHGSWTVPVTSFRGRMGVVLYGIFMSRLEVFSSLSGE